VRPEAVAVVNVVAVPLPDGDVAVISTIHSYPIDPVTAVQLSMAVVVVMLLIVRPVTGLHVVVAAPVVNGIVAQDEKLVALHFVRT
jgi:hypothetical protein